MKLARHARSALLLACFVSVLSAFASRADKPKTTAQPDVYPKLHTALRDIHNQGAKLFNDGDPTAAYYLFQGALEGVRPALSGRPDVQKAIDEGLAKAAAQAEMRNRAWELHKLIETVRREIKPGAVASTQREPPIAPRPNKKPQEPPPATGSLWDQLGGDKVVAQVVDDFVAAVSHDPKVNFDRNGKFPLDKAKSKNLKKQLIDVISLVSDGPHKYTGKSMVEAHKDMGITNAEFTAALDDLKKALAKNQVSDTVAQKLLAEVEKTRGGIVEAPPK